jgi:hypothetical protein
VRLELSGLGAKSRSPRTRTYVCTRLQSVAKVEASITDTISEFASV